MFDGDCAIQKGVSANPWDITVQVYTAIFLSLGKGKPVLCNFDLRDIKKAEYIPSKTCNLIKHWKKKKSAWIWYLWERENDHFIYGLRNLYSHSLDF